MNEVPLDSFKVAYNGDIYLSSLSLYKFSKHRAPYRSFLSYFSRKLDFDWKIFPRTPAQDDGDFDVFFSEEVITKLYKHIVEKGRTLKTPTAKVRSGYSIFKRAKEPEWGATTAASEEVKTLKEVKAFLSGLLTDNGHSAEALESYVVEAQLGWWDHDIIYDESEGGAEAGASCASVKKLSPSPRAVLEGYVQPHKKDTLSFTKKGMEYFCNWIKDEDSVYNTDFLKLTNHNVFA
jgi:hypothetical protein